MCHDIADTPFFLHGCIFIGSIYLRLFVKRGHKTMILPKFCYQSLHLHSCLLKVVLVHRVVWFVKLWNECFLFSIHFNRIIGVLAQFRYCIIVQHFTLCSQAEGLYFTSRLIHLRYSLEPWWKNQCDKTISEPAHWAIYYVLWSLFVCLQLKTKGIYAASLREEKLISSSAILMIRNRIKAIPFVTLLYPRRCHALSHPHRAPWASVCELRAVN